MCPTPNFQTTTEVLLYQILQSLKNTTNASSDNYTNSNSASLVAVINSTKIRSGTIILTATQPIQQLPGFEIPDGRTILLMSNPGNPLASIIYVDGVQPSLTAITSWPLIPGQTVGYQVKNANAVWVAATATFPLILNYTVEVN
jgi:hypothetical protein